MGQSQGQIDRIFQQQSQFEIRFMDNPELKTSPSGEINQWQAQFEDLRHLVVSILVLVVIMSGTFSVFLLRHWSQTRRDLAAYRTDASVFVEAYNKQGKHPHRRAKNR